MLSSLFIQLRKFSTGILLLLGMLFLFWIVPQQLPTSPSTESVLAETIAIENAAIKNAAAENTDVENTRFQNRARRTVALNAATSSPTEAIESQAPLRPQHDWLQLNDRNPAVELLQGELKSLGYESVGKTLGLFDRATERAVRRFQRSEGLVVDGIVGPVTQAQISTLTGAERSTEAIAPSHPSASLPPDIKRIKDRGVLVVSILNRDNPPFFMEDNRGHLQGSDITMAQAIASELGVGIEFRRTATTFNEVVDDVYALNADLAISKVSRTLNRAQRIRFSQPYLNLRQGLLINRLEMAENYPRSKNMAETIRNLTGKIGVIKGSSYANFAQQKFPKAEIISYASWPEVIEAVTSGEVLGAYRDELEVKKIVLSRPDAALQFQTVALTDTQDPLSAVLPWNSEHLLSFVNQYLESSDLDHTTDSLLEEYADYFQS